MQELFLVQENKKNLANQVFQVINTINQNLENCNYSTNELYQMLIYQRIVAPTKQKEFEKIIRFGVREGLIDKKKLYSRKIKEKKLPNFFTKEELVKFFSNMPDVRTAIACFIAVTSGLRISEVTRLRITDLDFNNETVKIVQSKGYKDGFSPFLKENHSTIKKWIEYSKAEDYLFESNSSRSMATLDEPHISAKTIRDGFNAALKLSCLDKEDDRYRTGRKKKTFHSLRHTFATHHLGNGVSPAIVKKAMRHEKMDTTVNVYGHITDSVMVDSLRGKKVVVEETNNDSVSYLSKMFIEGRITEEEYKRKKIVLMGD
jgi:integrase/recombinase XerD